MDYLEESGIDYNNFVLNLVPSPHLVADNVSLRDYQEKALQNCVKAGMRGCVVLPTGSGKTVIGIKAIENENCHTRCSANARPNEPVDTSPIKTLYEYKDWKPRWWNRRRPSNHSGHIRFCLYTAANIGNSFH